jgi:acyl-coenzyme A synthetase/AMP-(fatty) acid ligase
MSLFWFDPERGKTASYEFLVERLNNKTSISKYIYKSNPYDVFESVIYSLCLDEPVTLLDSNFSSSELKKIGISKSEIQGTKDLSLQGELSDYSEIRRRLNHLKKWNLELYTSGTTGIPKPVKHNFENLTRSVRTGEKYGNNRWGLTYNPTHFAGLQVFFQALVNKNSIYYLFESSPKEILQTVQSKKITNLSFTPTFFKQLAADLNGPYESVQRMTFGGEKFDNSLLNLVEKHFPNAKVNNIYASTEAGSLFASQGEYFIIPERFKQLVRVSPDNELLIHRKLLGSSEAIQMQDEWYRTGDIVELVDDNKLKFKSRESELINIGGYNVNPSEVEEVIFDLPFVKDIAVKPRANSVLGNILAAEVVLKEEKTKKDYEKEILDYCREKLQEWKVPRIIKFVDELDLTRSGKKKRES